MQPNDPIWSDVDFTLADIIYTTGRFDAYCAACVRRKVPVDDAIVVYLVAFRNVEKALVKILGAPRHEGSFSDGGLPVTEWGGVGEYHSGVWIMLRVDGSILVRPPYKPGSDDVLVDEVQPVRPSASTLDLPRRSLADLLADFREAREFNLSEK